VPATPMVAMTNTAATNDFRISPTLTSLPPPHRHEVAHPQADHVQSAVSLTYSSWGSVPLTLRGLFCNTDS
jgi:hypothetical protein